MAETKVSKKQKEIKKTTKEIVTTPKEGSLYFDVALFEHAWRVANMFATSTMVPEQFQGNTANCMIALNYAHRAGLDPFMLMQKMYIIHGKPSIETQLQIALFNKSSRYTALKFNVNESKTACTAYATEIMTGEVVTGPEVTIDMAKKEGWYQKKMSKWSTMPEVMLRYRAAAFFIRLYAPETTLGMYTVEELVDTPKDKFPQKKLPPEKKVLDIEIEHSEPEPKLDTMINATADNIIIDNDVMTGEEKKEAIEREQAEGQNPEPVVPDQSPFDFDDPGF